MATITFVLAISANIVAVFTLLAHLALSRQVESNEEGIRECATRTRTNTLLIDTFDSKLNGQLHAAAKPKAKRGRPRKKVDGK